MGRRYKNPPVVEAVGEFRFEPNEPWDLTIPGLVYQKLGEKEFPKKRLVQTPAFSIDAKQGRVQQELVTTTRMQFLREDEKAFIQLDQDLLSAHHLKPYPSWPEFVPLILRGFDAYYAIAQPRGVRRIGLRYINRIEIQGDSVRLEDFFQFYPFLGPNLPQMHGSFLVGVDIPYEGGRDILRLQFSTAVVDTSDRWAGILDLDYFLTDPGQVAPAEAVHWLQTAHKWVEEVFEACITDRLRNNFDGEAS